MKRYTLALGILAAFLVGCAASALHVTDPTPTLAQSHHQVHPNTVTGPCFKPAGTDCASTYHFVHGNTTLTTGPACATGVGCTFTSDVFFYSSAIFANTNYQCSVIGSDANNDGVIFNAFQVHVDEVKFTFRNETPSTIPMGTNFDVYYTCDGA